VLTRYNPPLSRTRRERKTSSYVCNGWPAHRRHRRGPLALVVAAALGIGVGAGTVSLTSSSGDTATRQGDASATAGPAVTEQVDARALWHELVALPARDQAAMVVTLPPSVRTQLCTFTEAIAGAAEGTQGG
jgi:hypothetical protein